MRKQKARLTDEAGPGWRKLHLRTVRGRSATRRSRPQPEPEPNAEKDFEEFVVVPRFCTVDRELSAKEGRLVLKWMNEI